MLVQSLGWEDPLEEGMATLPSILAWRIPWAEQPSGWQLIGSQRVGHNRSDWAQHTPQDLKVAAVRWRQRDGVSPGREREPRMTPGVVLAASVHTWTQADPWTLPIMLQRGLHAKSLQSCPTLYGSPPGSPVHGILQTRVGCHFLFQGIFSTQRSNPHLLTSSVLVGRFFTTRATCEALCYGNHV